MALGFQGIGRSPFGFQSGAFSRSSVLSPSFGQQPQFENEPLFQSPEDAAKRDAEENRPSLFPKANQNSFGKAFRQRSPFGPFTAIVTRGGRSLEELSQLQEAGPRGGTSAFVNNGSLTLENNDGETLEVQEDTSLTFQRQDDGSVKITSDSNEQTLTVQPGSNLTVSGEGRLNLFGEDNLLTVEEGGELSFTQENGETFASNPASVETLQLGSSGGSISIESRRSNQTDSLTLLSNDGTFISFQQGESGTIERNDDGTITVTNEDQSESVTFDSESSLDVVGEARGFVESELNGGDLELQKGESIQLATGEEETFTVTNESTVSRTPISGGQEPPAAEGPIQFQFAEPPETRTLRALNQNLIRSGEETRRNLERTLENRRNQEEDRRIGNENSRSTERAGPGNPGRNQQDNTQPTGPDRNRSSQFSLFGDNNRIFGNQTTNERLDFRNRARQNRGLFNQNNRFTQNQLFNLFSPTRNAGFSSRINLFA